MGINWQYALAGFLVGVYISTVIGGCMNRRIIMGALHALRHRRAAVRYRRLYHARMRAIEAKVARDLNAAKVG